MKGILAKSLIVSLVVGAIATLLTSVLTASYLTESYASGSSRVVTGNEAILFMVGKFGFGGYLATLFPWFVLNAITIFVGSVITAVWLRENA